MSDSVRRSKRKRTPVKPINVSDTSKQITSATSSSSSSSTTTATTTTTTTTTNQTLKKSSSKKAKVSKNGVVRQSQQSRIAHNEFAKLDW
eukprot:CAMPEP_0168592820 /NCGR_PEP_ID=MMETSP0420-20121227/7951_1 /TAXON_ID=498008 /ORGANISM="Pessonella sp." /LENGTH=89 /DNA_ID=CAMNT_0008628863 /DNA_START=18 /DNA_END=284 /DNA_ORIENTATION=-